MPKRVIAVFVPQQWVNDLAIRVDPKGEDSWDVTEIIEAMGAEALLLEDDQYETDDLRDAPNAPQWVKDWEGPFYVQVRDSILDYFEEQ